MLGEKELAKRKAEAEQERQHAANSKAEAEREMFWKDLIRWDPRCSHCQTGLSTHRNESVLVIDRLSCLTCVETVKVAALADNQKGLEA
ncbi:hypothetical protein [Schlesneria sp. T3-172]|uniref:hypothetical protein n=1 Tax=Schlesneria sphaerica TaxID=3373610 RepID=UPI0037C89571